MKNRRLNTVLFASINTADIDMITVKTLKALQAADVVIIDCFPKRKLNRYLQKDTELIQLPKAKMMDEEEHRSHVITIIESIESYYTMGKKIVRLVDSQTFLSKHIHTELRLLKSRKIKTKILPEFSADYHSLTQLKNVSFFSINCHMRNAESLWQTITDSFTAGRSIVLYSTVDIHDQFQFCIGNNEKFQNAHIDVLNILNNKNTETRGDNFGKSRAALYYIAH